MKKSLKVFALLVFFILCFLNVNLLVRNDGRFKLSFSTLIQTASAKEYVWNSFCYSCPPEYGGGRVYYACLSAPQGSCINTNCYYGFCD